MPQQPGVSDLHINAPLTNVSVAYFQDPNDFLADDIFPGVPVDKRSDIFWKYSKSDWRRTDAKKRAPGTESAEIGWSNTTDTYFAEVYAAHVDIDDQTRANADSNWKLDSDASRLVTNHLLLQKDQLWVSSFFQTGIWTQEYTGVAGTPSGAQFKQWDAAGSDPLSNFSTQKAAFRLSTGKPVSFMVVGVDVWTALQNHAAILDRIKYTQKGVVTEDLVAEFFGVKKFRVAWASETNVAQVNDAVTQDAAATYQFIASPKSVLFGYAPSSPSLLEPSAGYTFNWRGYGAGNKYGLSMGQMRAPLIKSDRIEGEAAYTMKVVSKDCGVFLNTVVS